MFRLAYRNFGSYEALVGNFVTDVDGNDLAGVRWFELRKSPGGPWTLFQEGTYSPDSTNRWMGAIAMDGSATSRWATTSPPSTASSLASATLAAWHLTRWAPCRRASTLWSTALPATAAIATATTPP